jgi:hypothetical protein
MSCALFGAILGACAFTYAGEPVSPLDVAYASSNVNAVSRLEVDCNSGKARYLGRFSGRAIMVRGTTSGSGEACFASAQSCEKWLRGYRSVYDLQVFEDSCTPLKSVRTRG